MLMNIYLVSNCFKVLSSFEDSVQLWDTLKNEAFTLQRNALEFV